MDKLRKVEKEYYSLYDSDGDIIASNNPKTPTTKKLSLKNCQSIERGYDLSELACNEIGIDISVIKHIDNKVIENDSVSTPIHEAGALGAGLYHMVKGFEIGFQKALEILGDKKFSEDDLSDILVRFLNDIKKMKYRGNEVSIINQLLQSLQQTEWDVEVEMEEVYDGLDEMAQKQYRRQPKLDADGCLILKRK